MHDVFISYKRERRDIATALASALSLHGWSVWYDPQLHEGENWRDEITDAHEKSRCVVVLWCADARNSDFVRDEAARAHRVGALVPIKIENIDPPMGFGVLQCVDLVDWRQGIDRLGPLINAIQRKIGPPGNPTRGTIGEQTAALELSKRAQARTDSFVPAATAAVASESQGPLPNFRHAAKAPEMVWVRPGRFRMGSPANEPDRSTAEGPQKVIDLPKAFFISKDPVRWSEWLWLYKQANKDHLELPEPGLHPTCPVTDVSWQDAVAFCERLSVFSGARYRLPSEAEWEYVCRAGQEGAFGTGDSIGPSQAIYRWPTAYRNSPTETEFKNCPQPVDHPRNYTNAFGVRGMHGNVWEWVADAWWHSHSGIDTRGSPRVGRSNDVDRVVKGGCWASSAKHLRSAFRGRWNPHADYSVRAGNHESEEAIKKGRDRIGFRIVCEM